ncbi:MAG: cation:proton antiporter [Nitrososphaerota archaeon]|jgi:NhaP-type Na+/H+ or K+/H+ antiporter|nr:cation:proton antiporter [Nitrososphaerota archaeon]
MSNEKYSFNRALRKFYRRDVVFSLVSLVAIVLLFASPFVSAVNDSVFVSDASSLSNIVFMQNSSTAAQDRNYLVNHAAAHVGNEVALRNAINNAEDPVIITFTADITLTGSPLNIPINKEVTLVSEKEEGFWKLVGAKDQETITINRGSLTLAGIIVTHNKNDIGRGVTVNAGSTLLLIDGEISGNRADKKAGNGGGVYNNGIFNMTNNAVIFGNSASENGGGVYNDDVFNMENGVIGGSKPSDANTAAGRGGGVYNANGCSFTMSGSSVISGNTAKQGNDLVNEGAPSNAVRALTIFSVVSVIIVVGFAGEFMIKKTGIPIFIFLILAGIVLGPGLNIFPRESLLSTLGLFATLTLLMVLFHAGLGLKTKSVIAIGSRVFIQTIVYTTISIVLIGLLGYFVLKWDFLQSFIFAGIIGGEITAAVIVPLSSSMKLREKTVTFLTIEAAISSVFSVVIFATLIKVYTTGKSSILDAVSGISVQFFAGIAVGFLLSLAWVYILHRFQRHKFTHVLTIGLIFATYSIAEFCGGNGVLSVLVFGIIFGNYHLVNRILKTKINIDGIQHQINVFYEEITFLLETLFFVSLGLIFVIDASFLLAGIMFTVALLITRYGAVSISTVKSDLAKDRKTISLMCALGLTPATLAILTIAEGIPLADTFVNIITYVIVFTNIVTAAFSIYYLRKKKRDKKGPVEQREITNANSDVIEQE